MTDDSTEGAQPAPVRYLAQGGSFDGQVIAPLLTSTDVRLNIEVDGEPRQEVYRPLDNETGLSAEGEELQLARFVGRHEVEEGAFPEYLKDDQDE